MLFHIHMERQGPESMDPAQTAKFVENLVLPTFRQLMELEKKGKLKGGIPAGRRALAFMLEADSIEEVDQMIQSLPLWAMAEVQVTPITPFEARMKMDTALVERMKAGKA